MKGIVTYSLVDIHNNTSKSATIMYDNEVDPMVFLLNFQYWSEENDFKYMWFSDLILRFCNLSKVEFYQKLSSGLVLGDGLPIGYDGCTTISLFTNTMIPKARIMVDLTSHDHRPIFGNVVNGIVQFNTSYLTERIEVDGLYEHILSIESGKNRFDVYTEYNEKMKKYYKTISDSEDGIEFTIDDIGFVYTKNVEFTLSQFKEHLGVIL